MNDSPMDSDAWKRAARAGLSIAGGVIPFIGGLLSAGASSWSEAEQENVNNLLRQWLQMLQDELTEKGQTIAEVIARIDMQDEKINARVESPEYQALLRKVFRNWSAIDSESKRVKVRNILANAAASSLTSDDVIRLFIDWITIYSDFHFEVIGAIYRNEGITRRGIWQSLGKQSVREDSPEADLYKLLVRDLSTGSVIRQHRDTLYDGTFVKKVPPNVPKGQGSKTMKSAFDDLEQYELTELGRQFVHYAMTELTPRVTFEPEPDISPQA